MWDIPPASCPLLFSWCARALRLFSAEDRSFVAHLLPARLDWVDSLSMNCPSPMPTGQWNSSTLLGPSSITFHLLRSSLPSSGLKTNGVV